MLCDFTNLRSARGDVLCRFRRKNAKRGRLRFAIVLQESVVDSLFLQFLRIFVGVSICFLEDPLLFLEVSFRSL